MKYLLIFIPILISTNAFGQVDFLSKKRSKYYYDGQEYNYNELDFIYQSHQPALDLYLSGCKLRKHASNYGIIGLGLWVTGVTLVVTGAESTRSNGQSNEFTSLATYLLIGSTILETITLYKGIKAYKKLKKAKNMYNYHMIENHGYNSDLSLNLAQTPNGIGLVLQF